LAQAPQFLLSDCKSTQVPLQSSDVRPMQAGPHVPSEQYEPAWHFMPQAPQLSLSTWMGAHVRPASDGQGSVNGWQTSPASDASLRASDGESLTPASWASVTPPSEPLLACPSADEPASG
jgi:hypothetical protein